MNGARSYERFLPVPLGSLPERRARPAVRVQVGLFEARKEEKERPR